MTPLFFIFLRSRILASPLQEGRPVRVERCSRVAAYASSITDGVCYLEQCEQR